MKKILIFSNGEQIGDGILKLVLIYQLRDRFPNYQIYWATDKIKTVYDSVLNKFVRNYIDVIWSQSNLSPYFWNNISDKYELENHEFDIIIDTQKTVLRTIALKRIKTKQFISATANWIFSDVKPKIGHQKNSFYVRNILQMFDLVSTFRGEKKFKLEIPENIKSMLSKIFINNERYIGFAPGAGQKEKIWSLKNYLIVAEYFEKKGLKPVFFLGPSEKNLKSEILKFNSKIIFPEEILKDISGVEIVMASTQFLSCAIGNDSGTSNMLATNLCPLLKLCGPTNAQKFINDDFENIHFISSRDYGGKDMSLIPVEIVIEKINKLLEPRSLSNKPI